MIVELLQLKGKVNAIDVFHSYAPVKSLQRNTQVGKFELKRHEATTRKCNSDFPTQIQLIFQVSYAWSYVEVRTSLSE